MNCRRWFSSGLVVFLLTGGLAYGHGARHATEAAQLQEVVKGMQASFALHGVQEVTSAQGGVVQCGVTVQLAEEPSGKPVTFADVVLRYTVDHEKFGQAVPLAPQGDGSFTAALLLHERGEQHFLLVVVGLDGVRREFHFHQKL